jgi:hypothetical protein
MTPVDGKKAVEITIEGITSDPSKDTWESFFKFWNYCTDGSATVKSANFESLEDKHNYLLFLEKMGII